MTRLLLVRHGLTDWNAAQRFQGQHDVPLNDIGRHQAAALAERLAGEPLQAIFASDLQRARATAAAIVDRHPCPITIEARLREISFGAWEGLTYAEIAAGHPEVLAAWEKNILENAPPGGETLNQLAGRVQAVLDELLLAQDGETILLVAHGGPLQVLICLALGLPPEKYWQFHLSPGSLSEIAIYPQGGILNLLNDTCHQEENSSHGYTQKNTDGKR
jgi:alpha-ribazole phosphatase